MKIETAWNVGNKCFAIWGSCITRVEIIKIEISVGHSKIPQISYNYRPDGSNGNSWQTASEKSLFVSESDYWKKEAALSQKRADEQLAKARGEYNR